MESMPWWSAEQTAFMKEVRDFVRTLAPYEAKTRWTREFPFEIYEKIGEKGYMGACIPKEYGGLGLGATGGCILAEEVHSLMPGIGRFIVGNMNGGVRQVIEHGSEAQKKKYLADIAKCELGAIVITEMMAGTDAAGMTLAARKNGDCYILHGKKRFIVGAGVADRYMVYALSDPSPEAVKKRRHLTAFIVKKGVPGFTTEKINEILGFENAQNGSLDFDNVKVSVEDRLGEEGQGWEIMLSGLNFERTVIAAGTLGWQRLLLNYSYPYAQRRVQFGKPTIDQSTNQTKLANMVSRLKVMRAAVYQTANLWDLEKDVSVDASVIKAFGVEMTLQSAMEATQLMGGDGVNRFYPVQNIFEIAKTEHIAGGTIEACHLTIFRSALKDLREDIQMPRRVLDEETGVPVPDYTTPSKIALTEDSLLKVLADDYCVNPGLHMTISDLRQYIEGDDVSITAAIESLEKQGLVMAYRSRKGLELAKATYAGLEKAYPREKYRWFPDWALKDKDKRIF